MSVLNSVYTLSFGYVTAILFSPWLGCLPSDGVAPASLSLLWLRCPAALMGSRRNRLLEVGARSVALSTERGEIDDRLAMSSLAGDEAERKIWWWKLWLIFIFRALISIDDRHFGLVSLLARDGILLIFINAYVLFSFAQPFKIPKGSFPASVTHDSSRYL